MLLRLESDVYSSFYRLSNLFSLSLVRSSGRAISLEETWSWLRFPETFLQSVMKHFSLVSDRRDPRRILEIAKCASRWEELGIGKCTKLKTDVMYSKLCKNLSKRQNKTYLIYEYCYGICKNSRNLRMQELRGTALSDPRVITSPQNSTESLSMFRTTSHRCDLRYTELPKSVTMQIA